MLPLLCTRGTYFIMITPILFHMPAHLLHVATSATEYYVYIHCKEVNILFIVIKILKNMSPVFTQFGANLCFPSETAKEAKREEGM